MIEKVLLVAAGVGLGLLIAHVNTPIRTCPLGDGFYTTDCPEPAYPTRIYNGPPPEFNVQEI